MPVRTQRDIDYLKELEAIYKEPYPVFIGRAMSRVAEDKWGRYLPSKLIGAIMKPRGNK